MRVSASVQREAKYFILTHGKSILNIILHVNCHSGTGGWRTAASNQSPGKLFTLLAVSIQEGTGACVGDRNREDLSLHRSRCTLRLGISAALADRADHGCHTQQVTHVSCLAVICREVTDSFCSLQLRFTRLGMCRCRCGSGYWETLAGLPLQPLIF